MKINDILELEPTKANLKKIDNFLNQTKPYSDDFFKTSCKRALVLAELNNLNIALKEMYGFVKDFSSLTDGIVVLICNTIMTLTVKAKRLDEYKKYMDIKHSYLLESDAKEKTIDLFHYYLYLKDYNQALVLANRYLELDLTLLERQEFTINLLKLNYELKNGERFLELYAKAKELYRDSFAFAMINEIDLLYVKYLEQNDIELCESEASKLINNDHLTIDEQIELATILIKIKLHNNELRQASIIESNYSEIIENANIDIALAYIAEVIKLYSRLGHKVSLEYFEKLRHEILEKKTAITPKKVKSEIISIPEITDEEEVYINYPGKVIREEIVEEIKEVSLDYANLQVILNLFASETKLREALRRFGMNLALNYGVQEFSLFFDYGKHIKLMTYKNERLYERLYDVLPDSLQAQLYKGTKDVLISQDKLSLVVDLFTNRPYSYRQAYSFTLNTIKGGIIYFVSDSSKVDSNYETLSFITKFISILIKNYNEVEIKDTANARLNYFANTTVFGFKEINLEKITLLANSLSIYGKDFQNLSDFYNSLLIEDRNNYQNLLEKLKTEPQNNLSISYRYGNKYIKEVFYSIYADDSPVIFSIVLDETKAYQKQILLQEKLSLDSETGFLNLNSFKEEIQKRCLQQLSIVFFSSSDFELFLEINDHHRYLDFMKILKEALNEFFKNDFKVFRYLIKEGLLALIFAEKLDKRYLKNKLQKMVDFLDVYFENHFLNYKPKWLVGVYKDDLSDFTSVYNGLLETFNEAKERYVGNHEIVFYSRELYKERFRKKVDLYTLNQALDNFLVELRYIQVVDIKQNLVFGYLIDSSFSFSSDSSNFKRLIQEKHLEARIDKYKITKVAMDLRRIYQRAGGYLEIMIRLNEQTIDANFAHFVTTQFNFFKIPYDIITFIVNQVSPEVVNLKKLGFKVVSSDIYDIINQKTNYFILDNQKIKLSELNNLLVILNNYDTTLYLENVNKADLEKIKTSEVKFVFGEAYKKEYNISDLLEKV